MHDSTLMMYLTCLLLVTVVACAAQVYGKQPNIVFVLADDYGWNDVGYHGSEIQTPTMDKLANEGVKLESYYVQPICTPSRSVLMSGRYQIHTGLQHAIIWPYQKNCLPLEIPTLADKLKETGYSNHMVGKWHLGFYKEECTPLHRGFDSFYGYLGGGEDYYTHINCESVSRTGDNARYCGLDFRDNDTVVLDQNGTYSTHLFTKKAQDVITTHNTDKPLFLYLAYQATHSPMEVPAAYTEKYKNIENRFRRIFAGMTSALDEGIANLTNTLKARGMWDNTVFIFSTDNGGQVLAGGNNWPLRGWKWSLWEGGVRGVGFVSGPKLQKTGYSSHKLMHISDWYPTLVRLGGGTVDDIPNLDGYDQWDTISQDMPSPRVEILHNIDSMWKKHGKRLDENLFDNRVRAAIRVGDWKLVTGDPGNGSWIPCPTSDGPMIQSVKEDPDKNIWLFNVKDDPEERNEVSEEKPEIVRMMLGVLSKYNETALPARYPPPDPECDPALHGGAWGPWVKDNNLRFISKLKKLASVHVKKMSDQFNTAKRQMIIGLKNLWNFGRKMFNEF